MGEHREPSVRWSALFGAPDGSLHADEGCASSPFETDRPSRRGRPRVARHGEQRPRAGHPLQRMAAPIFKTNAGPCDEIPHRARYQHVAGAGLTSNPRSCLFIVPPEPSAYLFTFALIETGPDG